jgi:hypothetical protein
MTIGGNAQAGRKKKRRGDRREQTQEACDRVKLYQIRPHGFPQPAKDRTMPEPATAYRFSFGPCNSSEGANSFGPDVRRGTLIIMVAEGRQFLSPG